MLPITLDHAERQAGLPFHHRDPFDRLIAAQALVEGIPLVSADAIFDQYGSYVRVWEGYTALMVVALVPAVLLRGFMLPGARALHRS